MGTFDHLLIRDSDSDSSVEPAARASPTNGSVTAAGPGETSPVNNGGDAAEAATEKVNEENVPEAPAMAASQPPPAPAPAAAENALAGSTPPAVEMSAVSAPAPSDESSQSGRKTPERSVTPVSGEEKPATPPQASAPNEAAEAPKDDAAPAPTHPSDADDDSYSYSYSQSNSGDHSEADQEDDQGAVADGSRKDNHAQSQHAAHEYPVEPEAHDQATPSSKGSDGEGAVFPGAGASDSNTSGGFSDELSPGATRDGGAQADSASDGDGPVGDVTVHSAPPLNAGPVPEAVSEPLSVTPAVAPPKKKKSMFSCLCCFGGNKDTDSDDEENARAAQIEPEVLRNDAEEALGGADAQAQDAAVASVHSGQDADSAARQTPQSASHRDGSVRSSKAGVAVADGEGAAADDAASAEVKPAAEAEEAKGDGEGGKGDGTPHSGDVSIQFDDKSDKQSKEEGGEPKASAAGNSANGSKQDSALNSPHGETSEAAAGAAQAGTDEAAQKASAHSSAVFEEVHDEDSASEGFHILEESPVEGVTPLEYREQSDRAGEAVRNRVWSQSLPPTQNGQPEDPYAHLPAYQRRILLDQRAKERREAEELAKQWKDLTFHPNLYKLTGGAVGRRASPKAGSRGASTHTRGDGRASPAYESQHRPSFTTSPLRHRPEVDAAKAFNDDWYKTHHSVFADLDDDDNTGVLTSHLNAQAARESSGRLPMRQGSRLPARRSNGPEDHEPLADPSPSKTFNYDDDNEAFVVRTPPRRMTTVEQDELFSRLYGHRTVCSASRSASPGQSPGQSPRQSGQATPVASRASPRRQRRKTNKTDADETVFNRLYNLSKSPRRAPETTPERAYSFHPQVTELAKQQASATRHRSVVDRLYPGSPHKEEPPALKVEALLSSSSVAKSEPVMPVKSAEVPVTTTAKATVKASAPPAAPVAPKDEPPQKVVGHSDDDTDDDADSGTVTSTTHDEESHTETDEEEEVHSPTTTTTGSTVTSPESESQSTDDTSEETSEQSDEELDFKEEPDFPPTIRA